MIYLASPYTAASNNAMEQRYRDAMEAVAELTNRGYCVYSPIVHYHPLACIYDMPRDYLFWETISQKMMVIAEELWVLQLPGWDASIGVMKEIEYWKKVTNQPIQYLDWKDRSAWPA